MASMMTASQPVFSRQASATAPAAVISPIPNERLSMTRRVFTAAERRQNVAPGVSPGLALRRKPKPRRGERFQTLCRPSGASRPTILDSPGLTPGATFCRRSAAVKDPLIIRLSTEAIAATAAEQATTSMRERPDRSQFPAARTSVSAERRPHTLVEEPSKDSGAAPAEYPQYRKPGMS